MPKLKFMLFSDIRTKTNQIHIIKIMVPHEFVGKKSTAWTVKDNKGELKTPKRHFEIN